MDLSKLPSPFYRGTVKAIVFDKQNRLLVGAGEENSTGWEMPGGGWEHNESLEECLRRELKEEFGAKIKKVGDTLFVYRGKSVHGWTILRIAVAVELENFDLILGDMTEARFVSKDELLSLDFAADEGTIKGQVNLIWPSE